MNCDSWDGVLLSVPTAPGQNVIEGVNAQMNCDLGGGVFWSAHVALGQNVI